MTDKQKAFCGEYLVDMNAKQAAIRAGYSRKSARQRGSYLIRNSEVREYLDELLGERSRLTGINAECVIRELARIAFINPPDIIDLCEAIASVKCTTLIENSEVTKEIVERELKLADKLKALELLGRHVGMFEKQEGSGKTVFEVIDPFETEDSLDKEG